MVGDFVVAHAEHFDVLPVVRAVTGNHRHEGAFLFFFGVEVFQGVGDGQVRHPFAFAKAVFVAFGGVDVRFKVHVGFGCREAHAARLHVDRLQIHGGDFHLVDGLRLACRVFGEGVGAGGGQQHGSGQCGFFDAHGYLLKVYERLEDALGLRMNSTHSAKSAASNNTICGKRVSQ